VNGTRRCGVAGRVHSSLLQPCPHGMFALQSLVMASITSEKHQAGLAWLNVRKVSAFLVCTVAICDVDLDAVVCSPGATRTHNLALPSNECMSGQELQSS
jgi:hypothetical protein